VRRIEVLPYHSLGEFKWEELGVPYTLKGVNPPDAERVRNAEEILRGEKE
jgi:pyruvate formate lyase activating enzyme